MSDQTAESTANVSGTTVQPGQTNPGASQVSQYSPDVKAIAAEVANILKPELQKMNQSEKDKRYAKFEAFMKEFDNPQAGQQTQPTQTEPVKTETATAQVVQTIPVTQPQVGNQQVLSEAEKTILTGLGLAADDVAVTSVTGNFAEKMIQYVQIAERRKQPANPAAVLVQPGGAAATQDQMAEELMALQQANPFVITERMKQLKQQLRI
jgi:hypothetical protein